MTQTKPRLDLAKLKSDDDDITGGYILEYRHGDNFKNEPTINSTMYVMQHTSVYTATCRAPLSADTQMTTSAAAIAVLRASCLSAESHLCLNAKHAQTAWLALVQDTNKSLSAYFVTCLLSRPCVDYDDALLQHRTSVVRQVPQ